MKIFFIISATISFVISVLFILSLISWLSGNYVLLPGYGISLDLWAVMWLLLIILAVFIFVSFSIHRSIRKNHSE